jgi:YegS/Rv2252/BmrU family lipid kinase
VTTHSGHATALAQAAVRGGRTLVVAIGGDGTLHEVANGVLDAGGGAAVGYVGLGTGGDFRRTLGIEHRLDRYIESIAGGEDRWLDVGKAHFRAHDGTPRSRWFINILSAGLGGLVDRHVAETSKAFGGRAAYFWASVRALANCRRGKLRCQTTLAGVTTEHVFDSYMIAICNGQYFGGGMHVAPMARPDDGKFEVIAMNAPGKLAFVAFSRSIYRGAHLHSVGVDHFACDHLSIDLENESARSVFLLDVDGEPLGRLPVDVTLVSRALRVRGAFPRAREVSVT